MRCVAACTLLCLGGAHNIVQSCLTLLLLGGVHFVLKQQKSQIAGFVS
jgi:hypothetical protein